MQADERKVEGLTPREIVAEERHMAGQERFDPSGFGPLVRRDRKKGSPISRVFVFLLFVFLGAGFGALFAYLMPLMGGYTRSERIERKRKTVAEVNVGASWRVPLGAALGGVVTAMSMARILRNL